MVFGTGGPPYVPAMDTQVVTLHTSHFNKQMGKSAINKSLTRALVTGQEARQGWPAKQILGVLAVRSREVKLRRAEWNKKNPGGNDADFERAMEKACARKHWVAIVRPLPSDPKCRRIQPTARLGDKLLALYSPRWRCRKCRAWARTQGQPLADMAEQVGSGHTEHQGAAECQRNRNRWTGPAAAAAEDDNPGV